MSSSFRTKLLNALKALTLPLLMAVFPVLFLYGNNVTKLLLESLGRALLLYSALVIMIFGIACILFKGQVIKAANAAFVFLIFFNLYGIVYSFLIEKDLFWVDRYTLLPFFLLLAIYASWFATKLDPAKFWNGAVLVIGALVVFNLVKIVPGEIQKQRMANEKEAVAQTDTSPNVKANNNYPDIYFIIFDEFAGFDTMRSYWKYQGVDDFVNFVKSKGFFVAENSHSSSIETLHQMVERLNYKEYPVVDSKNVNIYYNDINDSQVVRYLKSMGYTTVAFDETKYWFETYTAMPTDYSYLYDESNKITGLGIFFDEFDALIAENTMLKIFENMDGVISVEPTFFEQHRKYIFFTANKIGQLSEVPSPKFVYVHLMLPHNPFMFDAKGNPVDNRFYQNWSYYPDQYKFTISIIEKIINNILQNSDPKRPPVIIIQSDHGARMGGIILEGFPDDYKTNIMNIMYLPGFDISQLPQDMNPINTFPIIFNHLFSANIPLK